DGWPIAGPNYAPGDVNLDGLVNLTDFNTISDNLYRSVATRSLGDLNADGIVNYADFRIWKDNYELITGGAGGVGFGNVPEPGRLSLTLAAASIFSVVGGLARIRESSLRKQREHFAR